MRVDDFDYELPADLIAQQAVEPRDSSRLLVLDRTTGAIAHRLFADIGEFLRPGDCLVVNDTKVVPARLFGKRARTGGAWEGLFVRVRDGMWEFMTRTRGKPNRGEAIHLSDGKTRLRLHGKTPEGSWLIEPLADRTIWELLETLGKIPLPGYIRDGLESPSDRKRYQAVYANVPGAVAAPTAGLHFTPKLIERLKKQGVDWVNVTLHVGPGTFRPVKVENIDDHQMQSEWCEISETTAAQLRKTRAAGGRVIAVGTTTARTLESAWQARGGHAAFVGDTEIFIRPPHVCHSFDALVTNFHLPRSTLLMLVSAFAGREAILAAYAEAVAQRYRFYSYGDAMLIV